MLAALYLLQMCWKLYLLNSADLLPLNYSFPRLINMDSNLLTSSLHHPTSPSALLPSLLFHASLLPLFSSLTFFLTEKKKGVAVYEKSESMEYSNQLGPRGSAAGECTLKVLWEGGGCGEMDEIVARRLCEHLPRPFIPLSSPSPSKASQVYLPFSSASDFLHFVVYEQARHPPHSMVRQEGVCSLVHPFILCLRLELCD